MSLEGGSSSTSCHGTKGARRRSRRARWSRGARTSLLTTSPTVFRNEGFRFVRLRGTYAVYALLAASWCAIGLWQLVEHFRVREAARDSLYRRAEDISNTVGVVIR